MFDLGCAAAEPGEFTRALTSTEKLDLTAAEGIKEISRGTIKHAVVCRTSACQRTLSRRDRVLTPIADRSKCVLRGTD